jgi:hypothetical protein
MSSGPNAGLPPAERRLLERSLGDSAATLGPVFGGRARRRRTRSSMVARYHQRGRRRSARHGRRGPPRGPPSEPVSASWRDIVAAEAHDPLTRRVRPQWLVTCSCGADTSKYWVAAETPGHRQKGRGRPLVAASSGSRLALPGARRPSRAPPFVWRLSQGRRFLAPERVAIRMRQTEDARTFDFPFQRRGLNGQAAHEAPPSCSPTYRGHARRCKQLAL